jgi:type II secretory pathway predicted ATPase ExeA
MHFLIEEHRRLGLLLGPSGCGKSLLLEIIARRVRAWGRVVAKISLLGSEPAEFLATLADELRIALPQGAPAWRIWQCLERRLRENRYEQRETVLLLDDVDQAEPEVLTQVARIAKHDLAPGSRLTLILAGHADRVGRIGETLLDLAELRIDVPFWEPGDTQAFLSRSLEQAGGEAAVIGCAAARRMHDLAGGSPRRVRQLADLALLAAAGMNLDAVDVATVEAACEQLRVYKPVFLHGNRPG